MADPEGEVVEGGEGVAVADADDDAAGQVLADAAVEHRFGGFVEGGGGFVEEDGGGAGDEDAGEGDALEFARGEPLLPVVGGVEQGGEVFEAAGGEGGGDGFGAGGGGGVADGLAQGALGHVGFLGDEHDLVLRGAGDAAAAAEGPEAGEGAQEGGFAAAAGALDEEGVAGAGGEADVGEQGVAVGVQEVDAVEDEAV